MLIKGRNIGDGEPVYIIAELSANHNGSFDRALEIVRAAADAGADAIKLQTYTADTLTIDCDNEYFRIGSGTVWDGRTLHELYREAFTPWEWQPKIKAEAERLGMQCFSSPFDDTAVDFLEGIDVPAYKIASFELVDIPLIKYAASKGKPLIMSTGMASENEIQEAVDAVGNAGGNDIALLKCVSAYPAKPEEMNLMTIPDIAERFGVVAGLSDHTLNSEIAVAAVALGAKIIEKHLTISRSDGGLDSTFSMEPHEFKGMVDSIRIAEKAIGVASYEIADDEISSRAFRRSLFAVSDIKAGERFTRENVRSIRPGYGLSPSCYDEVLASRASRDLVRGEPLTRRCMGK
ncbi:MAG: pseudaminic acid synthase [Kiritimatiellaeota bacterium]|nr:pseudaminic acid synthase [Kiritimatiellota bacterium]